MKGREAQGIATDAGARSATSTSGEREFPAAGGHVTVRVVDFRESEHDVSDWRRDLLGRFRVVLAREPESQVSVRTREGTTLGRLPASWARIADRELWMFEVAGVRAVARATLTGTSGDRDLCVLLAWPARARDAS
ncbi:hypothetical protein [Cellulomonas sp. PhB150]|uniref:hypothetical protein n=1 Tax=Cellulomonas sp. PhB150 TaxID=2485188 RepID=UPI000F48BD24|nr:hypothetical protein [Cellulomonas sp. PhB150]ROS26059.1 hypothetical protein EDF34_2388 [Cellulomonas sp. PhB150]